MSETSNRPQGTVARAQLANDTWETLLGAHARLMRAFASHPGLWDEVTIREYDVLYTLSKCPRPQRLGDLSGRVLLSQPGLSRLVDRLVERGFVARCVDPEDARAVHLSLTEEGRAAQRRIGRIHARDITTALAHLSDEDLTVLRELADRLVDPNGLPNHSRLESSS